jgi:hypothetical protein
MTVTEPIPDVQYGRGNWADYISNWREKDAEWLQERVVLRYATAAARNADWGLTPRTGLVTYNDNTKSLEMYRGTGTPGTETLAAGWVRSLMFQYLTSVQDSAAGVNISHAGAAGKGALFTPTGVSIDLPVNLTNGVFTTAANNVAIQTPAMKKATLTTDSDELLSDTPLVAPGIRITSPGVIDAAGRAATVGALTAASLALGGGAITAAGSVAVTSLTSSGALTAPTISISGNSTINGVTFPGNYVNAAGGFVSGSGYLRGESPGGVASAVLSYRDPTTGSTSASALTADNGYIRLRGGQGIPWHNAAGTHTSWISPVIVSGGDPGAGNYPDGTIWIVP